MKVWILESSDEITVAEGDTLIDALDALDAAYENGVTEFDSDDVINSRAVPLIRQPKLQTVSANTGDYEEFDNTGYSWAEVQD